MREYRVPAQYLRFIERAVVQAREDAERDADFRSDDDPRIRAWASVPENLVDHDATGTALIVIGVEEPSDPQIAADVVDEITRPAKVA